jgi:Fe-S cluster assembly protein SufD
MQKKILQISSDTNINLEVSCDTEYKFMLMPNKNTKSIKLTMNVSFAKAGKKFILKGLNISNENDKHICEINILHNRKRTESNINVISFVDGKNALFNWTGNVLVKKNAKDVKTRQINRNYIWSKDANIITKPILITETDADATHKSTVYEFDRNNLFYLQSRGLTDKVIKNMLISQAKNKVFGLVNLVELQ